MKSRIYNNIIWFGIAALIVFLPLAKGGMPFWAVSLFELIAAFLIFLWLWRENNRKTHRSFFIAHIDLPLWLLVGLAGVSCYFSIYKWASLSEMLKLMMLIGIFYLVANDFSFRMMVRLAGLIIIVGTAMSLLGLGQYFGGLNHSWWADDNFLTSTYVNHNHFAGYLELAIPLAIGMLIGLKRDELVSDFQLLSFRAALTGALVIMTAALIFSQSRGAWLCLTGSLIVLNIVLIKRKALKKKSLAFFSFFIILGIVFIAGGYDAVSRRLDTVTKIANEEFLETRKNIWQGSINMIKANPLTGTGIGTFVWGFPAYRPKDLANIRAHYAHNDYLHIMAETGAAALLLIVWIIIFLVNESFRNTKKDKGKRIKGKEIENFGVLEGVVLGSAAGILSLCLHGLVDFNFHIPANILTGACLAGIIVNCRFKKSYRT